MESVHFGDVIVSFPRGVCKDPAPTKLSGNNHSSPGTESTPKSPYSRRELYLQLRDGPSFKSCADVSTPNTSIKASDLPSLKKRLRDALDYQNPLIGH